jgi:peptide chain release factor 3
MPLRNNDLIVGAVGVLQFDVVAFRLKRRVQGRGVYEPINVYTARWVECEDARKLEEFRPRPTTTSRSTAVATWPTWRRRA